jgi:hypothetical protein
MKTHPTISLILLTLSTLASAAEKEKPMPTTQPTSFAIIELFTSQGCSSCPPADALLAEILKDARAKNFPIYPLAFHVDYWDRLGWRDPFSDPAHSDRQRAYSRIFQNDSIYTPQMIINGQTEFVGSDRNRATAEIKKALEQRARTTITLTLAPTSKSDTITLHYTVAGAPADAAAILNIALVQRNLETKVLRGENAARTLKHDNVVRCFQSLRLEKPQGQIQLPLPANFPKPDASIIAYLQSPDLHILGATAIDLPTKKRE